MKSLKTLDVNLFYNYFWDASFPLFLLEGADNKKFLQGQTTADILGVRDGGLLRTCWLSPVGRLKALLEIRLVGETISFIVLGGNIDEVIDGFDKVIFPADKVNIRASKEIRRLQKINYNESWKVTPVEWLLPSAELPNDFEKLKPASKEMTQEWSLIQGLPYDLFEIDGNSNPLELGLSDLIDFDKGCYLGQETLAKIKNIGRLKCQLRYFKSQRILRKGDSLNISSIDINEKQNVGIVVASKTFGSSSSIGLALIKRKYCICEEIDLNDELGVLKLNKPIGYNDLII
ncbi:MULTISPECIES: CAF17-like 4Fe-4S cluster assembly/insertion protein YgfZ [Prochlorococcus]|uniref:CAF17-like 4Fe-4S cluster assembly/insertion protein YgfZ n=1 Tax=Prochlorococcus TaxID=1218 RepID=UPI000308DAEF|nr:MULTISPECIES: folate-binding protein YgfZ [Prochlorococcus]KGG34047.1 Folate-dependent protein for Fe/S cluster synthesis/repair in oxidative stress [Prochlorococcus marinus str. SS51]